MPYAFLLLVILWNAHRENERHATCFRCDFRESSRQERLMARLPKRAKGLGWDREISEAALSDLFSP